MVSTTSRASGALTFHIHLFKYDGANTDDRVSMLIIIFKHKSVNENGNWRFERAPKSLPCTMLVSFTVDWPFTEDGKCALPITNYNVRKSHNGLALNLSITKGHMVWLRRSPHSYVLENTFQVWFSKQLFFWSIFNPLKEQEQSYRMKVLLMNPELLMNENPEESLGCSQT